MTEVEKLISDMQVVKLAHPTLTITEVLKVFEIKALGELANQLRRLNNGR